MSDQSNVTNGDAASEAINGAPTLIPSTDIFETDESFIMFLDMPGADPQSLNVTLEKLSLNISAQAMPQIPQGYTLVHGEYIDGNYERAFRLSDQIDNERIDALFKDGVLRLTLPKASPPPAKKISVKSE
jgi:HSP20 family protein